MNTTTFQPTYSNFLKTFFLFLFVCISSFSQTTEGKIVDSFDTFIAAPREVVYVHMNKSTFIKSEMLGFSAYVLDKTKKTPSTNTTNLYVTISDAEDKILKSKLVKVENGFANNVFELDSLFSSGQYTLRAYTNWMRNFKERNYFEQPFQIIDPDVEKEIKRSVTDNLYTIDVFPEGGHLVADTQNQLGILVKDQKGFGLANAKGQILDQNENVIYDFQLNQFGIAKVKMTPSVKGQYRVVVDSNSEKISANVPKVDEKGFNISIQRLRKGKIALVFRTNEKTAQYLKSKSYYLAIHNGAELKTSSIAFDGKKEVIKILDPSLLYSGMNIFTVFDPDQNQPILERLYFNYAGISRVSANKSSIVSKQKDSLLVELSLNANISVDQLQNLSVSVLPQSTKSYQMNSSILSQAYLEPYVRGYVENAAYYFSSDSYTVQSNLDNLLITQGWSSYDWNNIFQTPIYQYSFEKGIQVKANSSSKKFNSYLVYPLRNNKTKAFTLEEPNRTFVHGGLFPEDKEAYKVTSFKKKRSRNPELNLEFFPSQIPSLDSYSYTTQLKDAFSENKEDDAFSIEKPVAEKTLDDVQVLDEIVLESRKEALRIEKIKNSKPFAKVHFITDDTPSQSVEQFLRKNGYEVFRAGSLARGGAAPLDRTIVRRIGAPPLRANPVILVNDQIAFNPENAFIIDMNHVDYIEINQRGTGYSINRRGIELGNNGEPIYTNIRDIGGVINVVTNPERRQYLRALKDKSSVFTSYNFPLTFDSPKKFYVPKYQSYSSEFFRTFGTIGWFPDVKVNSNGNIQFKIPGQYQDNINLYLEGIVNGKKFVSEVKTLRF